MYDKLICRQNKTKYINFFMSFSECRCYCMKVFVMVTTLTCGKVTERAKMLSQWIQIAVDLRTTFGNLFGFASVMEGLTSEHVNSSKGFLSS